MSKKISPNAPCPCGSGKKYKKCCWDKGFNWAENDSGDLLRQLPMNDEVHELLETQREKFRQEFGRDPGPDDKIFFDMPPVEHAEFEMAEAMRKAGMPPELIYAFEKTGLMVTEANQNLIPEIDLLEWDAAIDEYYEKLESGELDEGPDNIF